MILLKLLATAWLFVFAAFIFVIAGVGGVIKIVFNGWFWFYRPVFQYGPLVKTKKPLRKVAFEIVQ